MDLLAELRRRLGLTTSQASDALLQHFLDAAGNALEPWLVDDTTFVGPNVDEATIQLAVKLWSTAPAGLSSISPDGEWVAPAPSASPGLVRSVFGALGPALRAGGLSV